jgi:peptide deformylase
MSKKHLEILPDDHESLSTPCDQEVTVADLSNSKFNSNVVEMVALMLNEQGAGLAANQVGLRKRFFVMTQNGTFEACFNPQWAPHASGRLESVEEGCLSYLGKDKNPIRREVPRWTHVEASWMTWDGSRKTRVLDGQEAQCFQHETDHMDGVPFTEMPSRNRTLKTQ